MNERPRFGDVLTTLLLPMCERHSLEAEQLLLTLAEQSGNRDLVELVRRNRAFAYFGLSLGCTRKLENGRVWVGLNRIVLAFPRCCLTVFAAAHELGHMQQILSRQTEQPRGTWNLYRQELEASRFALRFLENSSRCGRRGKQLLKFFHSILAYQAAFPIQAVVISTIVLGSTGVALQPPLRKFWDWFWDLFYAIFRWIPFLRRSNR